MHHTVSTRSVMEFTHPHDARLGDWMIRSQRDVTISGAFADTRALVLETRLVTHSDGAG